MSTATITQESFADVLQRLGNVPVERIRARPAPGMAVPADVLHLLHSHPKRLCELIDGVLVEKAMGHRESRIGAWIARMIGNYLDTQNLGILAGADGPYQFDDDQVRYPDVSFISWNHIPEDADPETPMPDWAPTLAVEVISPSNTPAEMTRKLRDFFAAGVELVWYIYPVERMVRVYRSVDSVRTLTEADTLDGEDVLPGFQLSVRDLFAAGELRRPPA